jgi:hypothetical protein
MQDAVEPFSLLLRVNGFEGFGRHQVRVAFSG